MLDSGWLSSPFGGYAASECGTGHGSGRDLAAMASSLWKTYSDYLAFLLAKIFCLLSASALPPMHLPDALSPNTCQAMPFSLPSGEEYFEAYQYTEVLEKEYDANHLALCPNCAAEFQYACQTDENERADLILNVDSTVNEEDLVVCIDMPVHRRLRFTQRHLMDLQAAVKDWLEADSEPTEQEIDINAT
jgi:hypothetical protein